MSRQKKLIYLPLVGTTLFCLFASVYLIIRKRFLKPHPSTTTKHSVETSPEDTLKYWTADKMRNAKPAPLPEVNEHDRGKPHSSHQ